MYIAALQHAPLRRVGEGVLFDSSKIDDWINQWCGLNLVGEFDIRSKSAAQRISYTILNDGKEIKIDLLKEYDDISLENYSKQDEPGKCF